MNTKKIPPLHHHETDQPASGKCADCGKCNCSSTDIDPSKHSSGEDLPSQPEPEMNQDEHGNINKVES